MKCYVTKCTSHLETFPRVESDFGVTKDYNTSDERVTQMIKAIKRKALRLPSRERLRSEVALEPALKEWGPEEEGRGP